MRNTLIVGFVAAFALVAHTVSASYYDPNFSLRNESQCVGGTLIATYSDVSDTGQNVAAKQQATEDCQWLMTGPGQCCDVDYRRSTPQPPAIGSHVWSYEIYQGGTIQTETSPSGTLTSYYQRWAGISGGNSCSGTWQVESTDLSDASCPLTTSPNNLNIYGAVPTCSSSNPEGTACTGGVCKRNVLTSMSGCVIETTVYSCVGAGGQPITSSCSTAPAPVTASLVANPTAVTRGDPSLLTWSSSGATECSGTNFQTGGATSGTVSVRPTAETKYVVTCTGAGGSATASATVLVVVPDPGETFSVSCRVHPSRAAVGEDTLWSSTVTGGAGTYTYAWSGTEGLSGNGNQVFKKYNTQGAKTAQLTVTYYPDPGPQYSSSGGTNSGTGSTPPPPPTDQPIGTLPPVTACPAIAWAVPITPCAGTWTPSYDTSGCQSGWQCTAGGGGAMLQPEPATGGVIDTIINFFQFDTSFDATVPEIQDVNRDPGAFWFSPKIAEAACVESINNNQWYTATDIVPLASEGTLTPIGCASFALDAGYTHWNRSVENRCPGIGSPCEYDPARTVCYGVNNPTGLIAKPELNPSGGYPVHFDSGNVCTGSSCPAGQTQVPVFNVAGASCSGGSVVGRTSEVLDGVQIGMWPEGWLAEQCSELGATEGDCCEYAQRASNVINGGFPPNSYYQIRVVRGGSFSQTDASYIQTSQCSGLNLDYTCSSVAGNIGTQCSGGPTGGGGGGKQTKTVQCDNSVLIGAPECSDGIDNDGDGLSDAADPGCGTGSGDDDGTGGYNPNDNSESGSGQQTGAQCSDGVDNNGDGNVDYPDDPGCESGDDNLELSEPANLTLSVNPPLIKKDQQCTITLSARNVSSCSLTGSGISRTFTATGGIVTTKEVVTPGLQQTATYTLSCRGLDGKTASKKVDCKIAPTFEEI